MWQEAATKPYELHTALIDDGHRCVVVVCLREPRQVCQGNVGGLLPGRSNPARLTCPGRKALIPAISCLVGWSWSS